MSKYIFASIGIATFFLSGCTKEGLDGDATLIVKLAHHETPIASTAAYRDSVFIKFDVTDVPLDPTRDYDELIVGEIGTDEIRVEHPTKGNYSIYCTGWDSVINDRVTGGLVIEITRKQRKDEILVNVPLVE